MVAPPPMHETVEDDWRHITASAISPTAKAPSPSVGGGGKVRLIQSRLSKYVYIYLHRQPPPPVLPLDAVISVL